MAKMLGDNMRLFIKTGDATYVQPLGQGNLTINRSGSSIDTSDKNTGRYGTSAPGQKTLTITQAIQPNLPDAAYTAMKLADSTSVITNYEVRDITVTDPVAATLFACDMYTDFGNTDAAQKGVVGTSVTLNAAAAPTVDLI